MSKKPPSSEPDNSDYEVLRRRIKDLEEELATVKDGTQISRSEYEALEKRLRNEQDDHIQVIRAYRDMENRLESKAEKVAKLEEQIKKMNEQRKSGMEGMKNNEILLKNLKKEKGELESLHVKHRQDLLSYISENKKLLDTNQKLEAHIQEVDSALVQMLSRNKELARTLQESELRNENLLVELDNEKKNVYRLEYELSKLRDDERRDQRYAMNANMNSAEANAQQFNLLMANNTIKDLRARIAKLELEEQRAAKLQIELTKQKQINELLHNQNDELEMELESHRSSVDEYRKQIDDLRDKNQFLEENFEDKINEMKVEVEYYRKSIEKEYQVNTELEEKLSNKDKEIDDLKEEMAQYLSETYGLTQAVNEIRQLKAMVSVRDAQIADMILENQWDQKVISSLEKYMPSNFDFQAFFDKLQKQEIDVQQKQATKQALNLLRKTLEENKNINAGQVKIILGDNTRHKKTLIVSSNADGDIQAIPSESPHKKDNSSYKVGVTPIKQRSSSGTPSDESDIAGSSSEPESILASSQLNILMKRKKRNEKERKKQQEMLEHEIEGIPHVVSSSRVFTSDASCQTNESGLNANVEESKKPNNKFDDKESDSEKSQQQSSSTSTTTGPTTSKNDDAWVRELRNKLQRAQKSKKILDEQLEAVKEDFNSKAKECQAKDKEINGLKARIEDLLAEIDSIKGDIKGGKSDRPSIFRPSVPSLSLKKHRDSNESNTSISSDSSSRRHKKPKRAKNFDDPLGAELVNKKIQVFTPGVHIELHKYPITFEALFKPKLSTERQEIMQVPSPQELDIIDARIRALQCDVADAQREAATSNQLVEEVRSKIKQKDESISRLQTTIDNLEQRLNEQRSAFQDKIQEMKEDAERVLEARLKQARDMDAINNATYGKGPSESDLAEVSMRLAQLNRDKAKLQEELTDTKEAMKFMQRQNEQLKGRVRQLENDIDDLNDKKHGDSRQQALRDYSSELKMKYTALQKKYGDLQRQFEDLKKVKSSKGDPLSMSVVSRSSERSVDDTSDAGNSRDQAKLKSAMLKIEQMKTQNEEMQLRLGKAQTTIERLNQLLQRKEQQLTKLQEQATQYKHQLARQGSRR